MGCNLSSCCGIGSSVIGGSKSSVQYGYTDKNIELTGASGSYTIWDSLGISGISGTIVIEPTNLPAATNVVINGINTTAITNDIFSRSINPLNSVAIYATTSATTEICASVIGTGFSCT